MAPQKDYSMDIFFKDFLWALLLATLAVFAPIQNVLITATVLVFADFVVGIWAAIKRGDRIRSDKMRATVVKHVTYQAALCLSFITETYLLGQALPVTKIVGGLVGVVELRSVFENLDAIQGRPVFKAVIEKLAPENKTKNPPGQAR